MNSKDVINASNSLFSKGYTTIKSIEIIEEYEKTPYVTDRLGLRHQKQGGNISEFAPLVPMKKIKTGVRVKDSKGHNTSCAVYEKIKKVDTANECEEIPQE